MLKSEWGAESNGKTNASIRFLVTLQPWFLSLRWKTCLLQNCSLDSCTCGEEPALGQNTLTLMMMLGPGPQDGDNSLPVHSSLQDVR